MNFQIFYKISVLEFSCVCPAHLDFCCVSVASNNIPVRERGDWEAYLLEELAKHNDLTQKIIALETQLNAVVYKAFDLTLDEITLIKDATKYPYGAV